MMMHAKRPLTAVFPAMSRRLSEGSRILLLSLCLGIQESLTKVSSQRRLIIQRKGNRNPYHKGEESLEKWFTITNRPQPLCLFSNECGCRKTLACSLWLNVVTGQVLVAVCCLPPINASVILRIWH